MRKILLTMLTCCSIAAMAQQVEITKHQPLLKGVESGAYNPVLSADGNRLLFTGQNQQGLKLYDFRDDVVTTITDADRAGYGAQVTNDGRVYYVRQNREGVVKYRTAVCYNAADKSSRTIVENQRMVSAPALLADGEALLRGSKGMVSTAKSMKKQGLSVYTDGAQLIINRNGVERSFSPVESVGYLWASLSPDQKKVMFFAAGEGIIVMDLNGNVLARPGNYEMPSWMGNDYIVAQNAKDDGHQYMSSQIVLLKADGKWMKELTSKTSMSMQPTASSDAHRIVYSTIDGNLYVMELNINE